MAMSGGVDSSVAAALLKKSGFYVIGAFMKFWLASPKLSGSEGGKGFNSCCSLDSEIRARKVAKILKIPFYVFNFEKEFKKRIVDYFLKEYKAGRTPNPCVVCNKEIKFGLFLEKALKLDADFIATGHYARKSELTTNNLQLTTYKLLRAKDENKDQSYFLWKLNQNQLKHILFPVGNYTRKEVENLAKKFKLPFKGVKKSVEICFVKTTINYFLKEYLKEKPGNIIDTAGKVIGQHKGLWFYTIGQRKGIGLPGGPYWVLDKKLKKNILIVTKNEKELYGKELICEKINWLSGETPKLPLKIKVKIRYRHKEIPCKIYKIQNTKYKILFNRPQKAITPGQSVVFYGREELLGGGIISR